MKNRRDGRHQTPIAPAGVLCSATVQDQVRFADNLAEVARRGGALGPASRLLVVRCTRCHHQVLYDETHDVLFLDAGDLGAVWEGTDDDVPPCPGCADPDWEFEDVLVGETDPSQGPWSFCFWQPAPARMRGKAARVALVVAVGALAALGAAAVAMNPDPLAAPGSRGQVHDQAP